MISGFKQKKQSEVAEKHHKWRFFLVACVSVKYLMLKLKMFAGSLLWVFEHSESSRLGNAQGGKI